MIAQTISGLMLCQEWASKLRKGNRSPVDFGIKCARIGDTGILDALADNFKIPENGVLRLAVAKKNGFTFGSIVCNSNKAVACVCKKNVWILSLHSGTASLRIRRTR